jgi:hypothetical protein
MLIFKYIAPQRKKSGGGKGGKISFVSLHSSEAISVGGWNMPHGSLPLCLHLCNQKQQSAIKTQIDAQTLRRQDLSCLP